MPQVFCKHVSCIYSRDLGTVELLICDQPFCPRFPFLYCAVKTIIGHHWGFLGVSLIQLLAKTHKLIMHLC